MRRGCPSSDSFTAPMTSSLPIWLRPWPIDDPLLSREKRRDLQILLQRRGYDIGGDPDGHVGTKSKAAIADFQQRAGLEVNGRASVKVLAALKK
jgi:peptidoglycan hydrolase-like protein with peptidoglycan-binding domain